MDERRAGVRMDAEFFLRQKSAQEDRMLSSVDLSILEVFQEDMQRTDGLRRLQPRSLAPLPVSELKFDPHSGNFGGD